MKPSTYLSNYDSLLHLNYQKYVRNKLNKRLTITYFKKVNEEHFRRRLLAFLLNYAP